MGPDQEVVIGEPEGLPPRQAPVPPELEPAGRLVGVAEPLHLHLLELAAAVDEVAGGDLVAEGLADLGDAERDLDPHGV